MKWFSALAAFYSKHVHVRQNELDSTKEVIYLIDRFVDNKIEYPLEWDDFVSWTNPNQTVERLRDQLADLESSFMSRDKKLRHQALLTMIQLRNHYANLIGMASRDES